MKPIKSTVLKSPHFDVIMKKYEQVGTSMSVNAFYNEHVKKIDPNIKNRTWASFMTRYNEQVIVKSQALAERIQDKTIKVTEMEDNSIRKIMAIADLSLDQVISNPKLLVTVPIGERMRWLFDAMRARDSRMTTLTKVQQEKRKTSMYEDMMEGAQYGAIDAEEASSGMKSKIEPKRVVEATVAPNSPISEPIPEPVKPKSGKVVEFSPENM